MIASAVRIRRSRVSVFGPGQYQARKHQRPVGAVVLCSRRHCSKLLLIVQGGVESGTDEEAVGGRVGVADVCQATS
jgi:hypothetical protein